MKASIIKDVRNIEVLNHFTVWDNPIPSFVSRHAYFPGMVGLPTGEILAMFPVGQAFESWDQKMHHSKSHNDGNTWSAAGAMYRDAGDRMRVLKPTLLDDGSLIAVGYEFTKVDERWFNNETGGVPPCSRNLISFSDDNGVNWTPVDELAHSYPEVLEISGPALQLQSGDLLVIGSPMPMYDGTRPSGIAGIALRSTDRGRTWGNSNIYFNHSSIIPLEARLTQMEDGRIVAIVWALDEKNGICYNNHIVVSHDDGHTWSAPVDIGIAAQSSNVLAIDGNRLLSIHSQREQDPVGVFIREIDFTDDKWSVLSEACLWNGTSTARVSGYTDMGANLKFGQPAILKLDKRRFMAYHWAIQNGQGRIFAHSFKIKA